MLVRVQRKVRHRRSGRAGAPIIDRVARHHHRLWNQLAGTTYQACVPVLNLTPGTARAGIDPRGFLPPVRGKSVLCLACGGGQQSAHFGVLGARVTVADLSPKQLEQDHIAARHYGYAIKTIVADMRDLSRLAPSSFDIVCQGFSIMFVPEIATVYRQVERVLKPGGFYMVIHGHAMGYEVEPGQWTPDGYPVKRRYLDTGPIRYADNGSAGKRLEAPPFLEYAHTYEQAIQGLFDAGLQLIGYRDIHTGDPGAAPGTKAHRADILPEYYELWARKWSPSSGSVVTRLRSGSTLSKGPRLTGARVEGLVRRVGRAVTSRRSTGRKRRA